MGVEEVSQSGIGTLYDNNYDRHWLKCVLRHMGSGTRMRTHEERNSIKHAPCFILVQRIYLSAPTFRQNRQHIMQQGKPSLKHCKKQLYAVKLI